LLSKKHFVHCHNKLIVVDGKRVLVGSQNWSDSAVLKNREASLLIEFPTLAKYFAEIFEADWETGQKTLGQAAATPFFATASLAAGGLVRLSPGDYDEV
jgi:phosphatidylserine/phosphatidylglycerophosphate/cardiolipin synthase-like enzyme